MTHLDKHGKISHHGASAESSNNTKGGSHAASSMYTWPELLGGCITVQYPAFSDSEHRQLPKGLLLDGISRDIVLFRSPEGYTHMLRLL